MLCPDLTICYVIFGLICIVSVKDIKTFCPRPLLKRHLLMKCTYDAIKLALLLLFQNWTYLLVLTILYGISCILSYKLLSFCMTLKHEKHAILRVNVYSFIPKKKRYFQYHMQRVFNSFSNLIFKCEKRIRTYIQSSKLWRK